MIDLGGVSYGFSVKYDGTGFISADKDLSKLKQSVERVAQAEATLKDETQKLAALQRTLNEALAISSAQYKEQADALGRVSAAQREATNATRAFLDATATAEANILIQREQRAKDMASAVISQEQRIEQQVTDSLIRREQREKALTAFLIAEQNARAVAAEAAANKELQAIIRKEQQAKVMARAAAAEADSLNKNRLATFLDRGDMYVGAADRRTTGTSPLTGPSPASYNELSAAARRAGETMGFVTGAIEKDRKAQHAKGEENKNLNATFNQLNIALQAASHAFGGIAGVMGGFSFFKLIEESTILAARCENLGTVLNNIGAISGYTRGTVSLLENQVVSLGISTIQARESLALLTQGEIDLEQAARLARVAQDTAVIAGINSSDAFERLTIAIQRTNSWMLRNLGIMVNLNNIYRDFAITNGRMTNTISTHEKQQLVINEIFKKGAAIAGTYEAAMQDSHKQYTTMTRLVQEAKVALGEQFLPIFESVVKATSDSLKAFTAASDGTQAFTASILAASTAFVIAAGAIGTLTAAWFAFNLVMSTGLGPIGLVIAAIAALGAGAYVLSSAMEGNLTRAMEENVTAARASAASLNQLHSAWDKLNTIAAAKDGGMSLTKEQLEDVDGILADLIPLVGDFGAEISLLNPANPEAIAAALERVNAAVGKDVTTRIAEWKEQLKSLETDLSARLAAVETKRQEALKNATHAGQGYVGAAQKANTIANLDKAKVQNEIDVIKGAIDETTSYHNSQWARAYEQQIKDIETAHNLALRVEHLASDKRYNIWKDSNVDRTLDYAKTLDNLSNQVAKFNELERNAEAHRLGQLAELDRAHEERKAKMREEGKLTPNNEKSLDLSHVSMKINISQQSRKYLTSLKESIKEIEKAFENTETVSRLSREKAEKELEVIEFINSLTEAGEDDKVAKTLGKIKEQTIEAEGALKGLLDFKTELATEIADLSTKADAAVGNEKRQTELRNTVEKLKKELENANKEEAVVRRKLALEIQALELEHAEERKKIKEKLVEDLAKLEEKLHDEEIKLVKHKEDMELRSIESLRKAKEKDLDLTLDEINKEQKALDKFEDKIDKHFKKAVKNTEIMREFGKLVAQGVHPNAARAMIAEKFDILPVGVQRMKDAVEMRKQALAAQKEQAEAQKEQLTLQRKLDSEAKLAAEVKNAGVKTKELEKEITKLKDAIIKAKEKEDKAAGLAKKDPFRPDGEPVAAKDWLDELEDDLEAEAKRKALGASGAKRSSLRQMNREDQAIAETMRDDLKTEKDPKIRSNLGVHIKELEKGIASRTQEISDEALLPFTKGKKASSIEDAMRKFRPDGWRDKEALPAGRLPDTKDAAALKKTREAEEAMRKFAREGLRDGATGELIPRGAAPEEVAQGIFRLDSPVIMEDLMGAEAEKAAEAQAAAEEALGKKDDKTVAAMGQIMDSFSSVKDKALDITGKLANQIIKFKEASEDFDREFAAKGLS